MMEDKFFVCRALFGQGTCPELPPVLEKELPDRRRDAALDQCIQSGLIRRSPEGLFLTGQGEAYLEPCRVKNAIILAAGFGSRFVPLTFHTPKGLLPIGGTSMVERQILQLRERGIQDITLVVGYLRESFQFLQQKYGVKLVYNPEYAVKNNLATLYLVRHLLDNTYILSSDNWLQENMFHTFEPRAWYSSVYMEGETSEWCLQTQEDHRITGVTVGGRDSLVMYGPVYFSKEFSARFLPLLEEAYRSPGSDNHYWEDVLAAHLDLLPIWANPQPQNQVYELENLEELRQFDPAYRTASGDRAMACISQSLGIPEGEIHPVRCLSSGRLDHAFTFAQNKKIWTYRARSGLLAGGSSLQAAQAARLFPWHLAKATAQGSEEIFPALQPVSPPNSPEQAMPFLKALEPVRRLPNLEGIAPLNLPHTISQLWDALAPQGSAVLSQLEQRLPKVRDLVSVPVTPCSAQAVHGSFEPASFGLNAAGELVLDQWTRFGTGDPLLDAAAFAAGAGFSRDQAVQWLELFLGQAPAQSELVRFLNWGVLYCLMRVLEEEYRRTASEEVGTRPEFYSEQLDQFLQMLERQKSPVSCC